jgi:hypothetical protein
MGDVAAAQQTAIYDWLAHVKSLARQGDMASRAMLAGTETVQMIDALAALLREHEPDRDGRCPSCPARAQRRGYRCVVWATVHAHLVAGGVPAGPGVQGGRHALSSQGRGLASW